jgi:hypothetical protein
MAVSNTRTVNSKFLSVKTRFGTESSPNLEWNEGYEGLDPRGGSKEFVPTIKLAPPPIFRQYEVLKKVSGSIHLPVPQGRSI